MTTFEAPLLDLKPIEFSAAYLDRLWQQLDRHIAPTVAALLRLAIDETTIRFDAVL